MSDSTLPIDTIASSESLQLSQLVDRASLEELIGSLCKLCGVPLFLLGSDGARLKGIAFRSTENELGRLLLQGRNAGPLHVAGHLRLDRWQGQERVQMTIEDAARVQ